MNSSLDTFPVPLITLDQTNSTSTYLRDYCREECPAAFTTVIADYQVAGRGQRGNFWESEKGRNLLFSFVLYPNFLEARRQFLLSQIVALAIKETLDTYTSGITIKWPNDIYWQEQKMGGMLIENELMGNHISQSIVGVGINLNQQEFQSSAPNPVSLWQITRKEHDCLDILAQVMGRIKEYYTLLLLRENSEMIATRYQEAIFRRKGMYPYSDATGKFLAEIVKIEPDGFFVLKDEKGSVRKYAFKEVQYLL